MYEYILRYCEETEWKMIFINPQHMNKMLEMPDWNYRCNLFVVIDYVISYADQIGKWIEKLVQGKLTYKIRIVLLEREGIQDNSNGGYDNRKPLWLTKMYEDVISAHSLLNSLYSEGMLPMTYLSEAQLKEIAINYAERQNSSITDKTVDYLIAQLSKIDEKYLRPIYLLFITDAYLKGQDGEWDKRQLESWLYNDALKKIEGYFGSNNNQSVFNAYKALLCIATMCGGVQWKKEDVDKVCKKYIDEIDKYAVHNGKGINDILDITEYYEDDMISPMEPDLMGEYFCISYLENEINNRRYDQMEEIHQWIQYAWEYKGIEYSAFLSRLINDYPHSKVCNIEYLFQPPKRGIMLELIAFYLSIVGDLADMQQIDQRVITIDFIKDYAESEEADDRIKIVYAKALANFANERGGEKEVNLILHVKELLMKNPNIHKLRSIYAFMLANHTYDQDVNEMSEAISILKYMYSESNEDIEYSGPYARALANLSAKQDKKQISDTVSKLKAIYDKSQGNETIADLYCQGLFNFFIKQDENKENETTRIIEELYMREYSNITIKEVYATTFANLISEFEKDKMDYTIKEIRDLYIQNSNNERIKVAYVTALFNLTVGKPKELIERSVMELKRLFNNNQTDGEIRLKYASSLVNLSPFKFGEERKKLVDCLKELINGEEKVADVRLQLEYVKALTNLIPEIDNVEMEKVIDELKLYSERNVLGNEFKLLYAKGLNNYYFYTRESSRNKVISELEKLLLLCESISKEVKDMYVRILGDVPTNCSKGSLEIDAEKLRKVYLEEKNSSLYRECYVRVLGKLSVLQEIKEHKNILNCIQEILKQDDNEVILQVYMISIVSLFCKCNEVEQEKVFKEIQDLIDRKGLKTEYIDLLIIMLNLKNIKFTKDIVRWIENYMKYNTVTEKIKISYAEALKNILRELNNEKEIQFTIDRLKSFYDCDKGTILFKVFYIKGIVNTITNSKDSIKIHQLLGILESEMKSNVNYQMLEDYFRGLSNCMMYLTYEEQVNIINIMENITNKESKLKYIYALALYNIVILRHGQPNRVVIEKLRLLMNKNMDDGAIKKIYFQACKGMM